MNIEKLDKNIKLYTVKSDLLTVKIADLGASICNILLKDKNGKEQDVVLGHDNADSLINQNQYIGSAIGRFANRIAGGKFAIGGNEYKVTQNEGENSLHGGGCLDKKLFTAEECTENSLLLSAFSPDGENGFPGDFKVFVRYSVEGGRLSIEYRATCSKDCPVNLTNHSYFNLSGEETIAEHIVSINADYYTPLKDNGIPTGEILPLAGSVLDFKSPKRIGDRINDPSLAVFGGYDHNYCLLSGDIAATAYSKKTGIFMEVQTDLPGLQFYTGNGVGKLCVKGKQNQSYHKHQAFCMETQFYPDSPNHKSFPDCILKAGSEFNSKTSYIFSIK